MASKYLKYIARPNAMNELGEEMKRFPSDSKNHEKASKKFKILRDLINGVVREAARPTIKATEREIRIPPEGIFNVLPKSATPTAKAGDKQKKIEMPPITQVDAPMSPTISKKRKRVEEKPSNQKLNSASPTVGANKRIKFQTLTTNEAVPLEDPQIKKEKILGDISHPASISVAKANERIKIKILPVTKVDPLNDPQISKKRKRVDEELSVKISISISMSVERANKRIKIEMSIITEVDRLNGPKASEKRNHVEQEFSVEMSDPYHTVVERPSKRVKVKVSVNTEVDRLNGPKTGEKRKCIEEDIPMEISSAWKRMKIEMPAATIESVSGSSDQKTNQQIEALGSVKGTVADESIDPTLATSTDESSQQQAATEQAGTKPEMCYTRPVCAHFQHTDSESQPLVYLRGGGGPTAVRHGVNRRSGPSTDEDHPGINQSVNSASKRQKKEAHRQRPHPPTKHKVKTDKRPRGLKSDFSGWFAPQSSPTIGQQIPNHHPPALSNVILGGVPPPRVRTTSNTSAKSRAKSLRPQALAPKSNTTRPKQKKGDLHTAKSQNAEVQEFKNNFLQRRNHFKEKQVPEKVPVSDPPVKEPMNVDEALTMWYGEIEKHERTRNPKIQEEETHIRRTPSLRRFSFRRKTRQDVIIAVKEAAQARPKAWQARFLQSGKDYLDTIPAKHGHEIVAKILLDVGHPIPRPFSVLY